MQASWFKPNFAS